MPSNIKKHVAISPLLLLFCGTVCFAKPLENPNLTKPIVTKPTDSNSSSANASNPKQAEEAPAKALFDVEENNTTVSDFAKEYAALMKKAKTAIHINRPLKMDEEKQLWADYKSGKYAKNKEFMRNMKLAEPYHNRLRSILHVFESQKFKHLEFSHPAPIKPTQSPNK